MTTEPARFAATGLVSVIVRSMDRPTLSATLASVLAQDWPQIEVLVVNAKGGEHSALPQSPRPGITLRVINQNGQPLGRSHAANAGLDAVSGDVFAFLDDDDSLDPGHYSQLMEFQAGRHLVVYAGVRSSVRGEPENSGHVFHEDWEQGKLLAGNFLPIHAPLVPVACLAQGVRFDPDLDIYEDWDFWLQLSRCIEFARSPHISATYFLGGDSGANPQEVEESFTRRSTFRLYQKWLPLLRSQDLWEVTRLYHTRNLTVAHLDAAQRRLLQDMERLGQELATRNHELAARTHELNARTHQLQDSQRALSEVYQSTSWRITAPLRKTMQWVRGKGKHKFQKARNVGHFAWQVYRQSDGALPLLRKAWAIYQSEGRQGILRRLPIHRTALDAAMLVKQSYFANHLVQGPGLADRPKGGIAIIVHAYYPDVFQHLADAMQHMPWDFDLYVSVTTEEARQQVAAMAATIAHAKTVDVQITPNRGRDIAPFLVTFADAIRSHEYVLHLHTKKSLYSGRERTEWRDYMLGGLLGSEQRIRHIFQQFSDDAGVGVIYPDTFESLPYWAHSWLQNRGIALGLAARLQIDISHLHYVDAPMGSMFWARSQALAPLLDLNLGYQDFPDEKGQTDGTLQHTIERFIVLCAFKQGLSARALLDAPGNATLFFSPGSKNLHQYYAMGVKERIVAAAASARIVSFDIFDTLLLRPWYSPENTFDHLQEHIARRWGLENFKQLRKQAEQLARQEHPGKDVNIAQIYEAFQRVAGCSPTQAQALLEQECEHENTSLFPNPEVCAAARLLAQQGKRLVLVSDMYLPADFLESLLARHGLDFFAQLYVSNSCHARKDNATMWKMLPEREGVEPQHWLHVGDNEHSDIQRPLDLGYPHPAHTMRAADQFMLFNEEASVWMQPQHWQEGLQLGLMANRLFVPGLAQQPVDIDCGQRSVLINSLHDFGYVVMGPALSVFMAWLLQRAETDGIEKLLYASREGHLLVQAHQAVEQHRSALGQRTAEGAYFLCSRPATGLAAAVRAENMALLLQAHFTGSFADLLRQRFCVQDLTAFTERWGEKAMQQPGRLPEDSARFTQLLNDSFDLLQPLAAAAAQRYQGYAQDIMQGKRCALVDIGYAASIQKLLSEFVDGLAGGYYFVTTEKADAVSEKGQFAQGCFGQSINPFHSDIPLYQYALLLEAILTAPHGQLQGFDEQGQPRYKAGGLAQEHFADLQQIHAGSLAFLHDALKATGSEFFSLGQHQRASQLPIRQVMQGRWKLGFTSPALHVEDNFSGNEELSVFDFYERMRQRMSGVLN